MKGKIKTSVRPLMIKKWFSKDMSLISCAIRGSIDFALWDSIAEKLSGIGIRPILQHALRTPSLTDFLSRKKANNGKEHGKERGKEYGKQTKTKHGVLHKKANRTP